jgi:uncharacterized protein (DUF1330 family)
MAVYLVNSYDITDMETFKSYPPQVLPILKKHGAKVLSSDPNAIAVEGYPKTMNAIIEFPSEQAVWNCYNDPEYEAIKHLRISSTANCTMLIVKEFTQP